MLLQFRVNNLVAGVFIFGFVLIISGTQHYCHSFITTPLFRHYFYERFLVLAIDLKTVKQPNSLVKKLRNIGTVTKL